MTPRYYVILQGLIGVYMSKLGKSIGLQVLYAAYICMTNQTMNQSSNQLGNNALESMGSFIAGY